MLKERYVLRIAIVFLTLFWSNSSFISMESVLISVNNFVFMLVWIFNCWLWIKLKSSFADNHHKTNHITQPLAKLFHLVFQNFEDNENQNAIQQCKLKFDCNSLMSVHRMIKLIEDFQTELKWTWKKKTISNVNYCSMKFTNENVHFTRSQMDLAFVHIVWLNLLLCECN